MKRIIRAVVAAAVVCSLAACTKEGPKLFKGNYSFKTSGTVEAEVTYTNLQKTSTHTLSLSTEQGQMDIIDIGSDNGEMLITMNVLSGDVRTFKAVAQGSEITIEPTEARVKAYLTNIGTVTLNVIISGTGVKYDDTVIFDLEYASVDDADSDDSDNDADSDDDVEGDSDDDAAADDSGDNYTAAVSPAGIVDDIFGGGDSDDSEDEETSSSSVTAKVIGSSVQCVAKLNK